MGVMAAVGIKRGARMRIGDVFARVVRQAEERRAEYERIVAVEKFLAWKKALVLRLLVLRFGAITEDITSRVLAADETMLNEWLDSIVVATRIEEIFARQ